VNPWVAHICNGKQIQISNKLHFGEGFRPKICRLQPKVGCSESEPCEARFPQIFFIYRRFTITLEKN